MSADCGKFENCTCFRHTHKGDFPKFGHILFKGAMRCLHTTYGRVNRSH